jgi:hypothetical protein
MTRINPANLVKLALTAFVGVVSSKIVVLHPEALKNSFTDGQIKHLYANFGFIPYG